MTLGDLRTKCGVSLEDMAERLRVSADALRRCEGLPLQLWELRSVDGYVAALGFKVRALRLVRESDGHTEELEP